MLGMIVFMWFLCFEKKTAYAMRIRDWSSDVCSSDLEAHAERQAVAVGVGLQDGLRHAMHQRGQRDVRMPGDFDLQRRRAVGDQPLRQPVGQADRRASGRERGWQ